MLDKSKISRWGVLFLIIFKLWYKRTPLTGKPRNERPSATAPNLPGLGIEVAGDSLSENFSLSRTNKEHEETPGLVPGCIHPGWSRVVLSIEYVDRH